MNLQVNYKHLAAEFVVIFVGVLVALAADRWQEDNQDRDLEAAYVGRLLSDLAVGRMQLESTLESLEGLVESSAFLIETYVGKNEVTDDLLAENLIRASRSGYSNSELVHNNTYQELMATGRLNLVEDQEILRGLADYYRLIMEIDQIRDSVSRATMVRYEAIVGRSPYELFLPLSEIEKARLLEEYRSDPAYIREVRQVHGRALLVSSGYRFPQAFDENEKLANLLE